MIVAAAVLLALLLVSVGVAWRLVAAARASEADYASVVDQLPGLIVTTFGPDLKVRKITGGGYNKLTLPRDQVIGKRPDEFLPDGDGARFLQIYKDAFEGETKSVDWVSPFTGHHYMVLVAPIRRGGEIVGGTSVSRDISDLRRAEADRVAELDRRGLILDAMNDAYVAADANGLVTDWNIAAEQIFGYTAAEAIGKPVPDLIIPPEDRADFWGLLERGLEEAPDGRVEVRADRGAVHKDGTRLEVELSAVLLDVGGEVSLLSLMQDISYRKRTELELRGHASDLEVLSEAVGELARSTDGPEARMSICRAATRVAAGDAAFLFEPDSAGTGLVVTACEGASLIGYHLPFSRPSGATNSFASARPVFISEVRQNPLVNQALAGEIDAVSALWFPVMRDDEPAGVMAISWQRSIPELTERLERVMGVVAAEASVAIERAELLDRLGRMARTDDLTGLPNRRAWDQELSREIGRAQRDSGQLSVAMFDLDRFKVYNDRLGHQAGDRLLKEAAVAWRSVLRDSDLLARYGGEEFAVALPGCDGETARRLVERLRAATPGGESCSAGLACWNGRESADALLGRADDALYRAKQTGRDRTVMH